MNLPQFYHLNRYRSNFLRESSRIRFTKTPPKALLRPNFGGYAGFVRLIGVKTGDHHVASLLVMTKIAY